MSRFPRIDKNHPLTEAARYTNAYSEEHGLEDTVTWSGMGLDIGELAYLAEQRALRAVAASAGINLGVNAPEVDQAVVDQIVNSQVWDAIGMTLIAAYIDGLTIGWVGHRLKEGEDVSE